jgi:hypothetical protein
LKISFAEGAIGSPSEGMAAHAGRSPVGGRNSDEWLFDDGIDGVGRSYSSLVPDPQRREKCLLTMLYMRGRAVLGRRLQHSKFALAQLLCVAQ